MYANIFIQFYKNKPQENWTESITIFPKTVIRELSIWKWKFEPHLRKILKYPLANFEKRRKWIFIFGRYPKFWVKWKGTFKIWSFTNHFRNKSLDYGLVRRKTSLQKPLLWSRIKLTVFSPIQTNVFYQLKQPYRCF